MVSITPNPILVRAVSVGRRVLEQAVKRWTSCGQGSSSNRLRKRPSKDISY